MEDPTVVGKFSTFSVKTYVPFLKDAFPGCATASSLDRKIICPPQCDKTSSAQPENVSFKKGIYIFIENAENFPTTVGSST